MILNINIGILGHVDSGKTTLAKSLSEISSTAAFDKNPQSQERGITLDLGFSSLQTEIPVNLSENGKYDKLQFTFVDCPGHASLIRTIIGGAQIIDLMILVIDVNKGIQTQTAECLVIGELTCKNMIVVLNKIDLIDEGKRAGVAEKMTKKIKNILGSTIFKNSSIIEISAIELINLDGLIEAIKTNLIFPERTVNGSFLFSVDHCFAISGKGTICTGTILEGEIKINDEIEIPQIKMIKKVKSIQMFKKSINSASQGDRIGICITQFDPKLLERGIIAKPGYVSFVRAGILKLNRIKYFKGTISSRTKFHITIGHETVLVTIQLFKGDGTDFDWSKEYKFIECAEIDDENIFVLLEFEKSVLVPKNHILIGSKLDMDIHTSMCRLAFHGRMDFMTDDKNYTETILPNLKVFKEKVKEGSIQRIVNENEIIVSNLFKKESTNRELFVGLKVCLESGDEGIIESTFGQTSKMKVRFMNGLSKETLDNLKSKTITQTVSLKFKKYIFSKSHRIVQ